MAPLGTRGSFLSTPTTAKHLRHTATEDSPSVAHHITTAFWNVTFQRREGTASAERIDSTHNTVKCLQCREMTKQWRRQQICLRERIKKEVPESVQGKQQRLQIIKLRATLSHGEPRLVLEGPPIVATHGQTRVDGAATMSSSLTCPQTLQTQPRVHQRKTRRNTPVTGHTAREPTQHGEGLRQAQVNNIRSDKAEPDDNPRQRQTHKINKGSARAKPVPARTATKPRRSTRTRTGPPQPPTARDERARTQNINKQLIGIKQNSANQASRKIIKSLIRTHTTQN